MCVLCMLEDLLAELIPERECKGIGLLKEGRGAYMFYWAQVFAICAAVFGYMISPLRLVATKAAELRRVAHIRLGHGTSTRASTTIASSDGQSKRIAAQ